jgi:hypothetical protein
VCLSSVALKAFSRIIERMAIEGELEEEQAAFRPGRQTQDPIHSIQTICDKFIERVKKGNLAFLHFKAAFDTVPREEIWNALARKNVPSKLIRVIKAMYETVEGVVRFDGKLAYAFLMERGVKQGDSLSPLSFILFMDEVLKICKRRNERMTMGYWNMRPVYCQALLYADDIVLIADSEEKLRGAVIEWTEILRGKGMAVNDMKSKVMSVHRIGDQVGNLHIMCNNRARADDQLRIFRNHHSSERVMRME